jgi:hypothetical protein
MLMRAQPESEIDSDILRHDARNLQLKRRLAERGIDFRGERPIICNFRAPNQRQASQLEQALIERGFFVLKVWPTGSGDHCIWHVRAQVEQTIGQVASHEFSEAMVRSAAKFSCLYDGWSACI